MHFTVSNWGNFQTSLCIHNINARKKHHLHRPNANLSCFQESTFNAGIRIFSSVPYSMTVLENGEAKFKLA